MVPCANCTAPTMAVVIVDGDPDAVIWRCRACHRSGRPAVTCSPGCFYEHAADHEAVEFSDLLFKTPDPSGSESGE